MVRTGAACCSLEQTPLTETFYGTHEEVRQQEGSGAETVGQEGGAEEGGEEGRQVASSQDGREEGICGEEGDQEVDQQGGSEEVYLEDQRRREEDGEEGNEARSESGIHARHAAGPRPRRGRRQPAAATD